MPPSSTRLAGRGAGARSLERRPRPVQAALLAGGLALSSLMLSVLPVSGDPVPPGWRASNMQLVGFSGLGSHTAAFKLAIKQSKGRWYLYTGHSFESGWSIIDVTDPKNPKYIKFIPGPPGVLTSQITLHDDLLITGLSGQARAEANSAPPLEAAVGLWDISDPTNPKQISSWKAGPRGTHRNSYPGGKYAYLSVNDLPGYRGRMLVILDVSDPKNPKEAGKWWQPGQKEGETKVLSGPLGFHGPATISPDGKMATMGYSPGVINLDISDIQHPKLIGMLQMSPPFAEVGAQSEHTALPIGRDILFADSEASASGCDTEALHYAALIDNKNPAKPRLMSLLPVPRPPNDAPYKDFCDKGGRFGPHNISSEVHSPDVQKPGNTLHLTYFNAGLRVFDITDPHLPTEIGWFMPPERPEAAKQSGPHESPTNWSEDVLVDTRGYVYVSDDKWGVWILKDTVSAKATPGLK